MRPLEKDTALKGRHIAITTLSAQQYNSDWLFVNNGFYYKAREESMIVFGLLVESGGDIEELIEEFIHKGAFKKYVAQK